METFVMEGLPPMPKLKIVLLEDNNNNPVALQPYRALAERAAAAGQRS